MGDAEIASLKEAIETKTTENTELQAKLNAAQLMSQEMSQQAPAVEGAAAAMGCGDSLTPKSKKINELTEELNKAQEDKQTVAIRAANWIKNLENANGGLKEELD